MQTQEIDSGRAPVPGTRASRREDRTSERRCIVTRELGPKEALIRFVVAPDGTVTPDLENRLPGRGLWVIAKRGAIDKASTRGLFAKAAGRQVTVPPGLSDSVATALRRRCLSLIGLAQRAGKVTSGFERTRARLAAGKSAALVQAVDAARGGRAKLAALGKAVSPGLSVIEVFTGEELGQALGRGSVVHLVLAPGGLTDRLGVELARLAGLTASEDATPANAEPARGPVIDPRWERSRKT